MEKPVVGGSQHLKKHQDQEHQDAERRHRFVLPMAVRVVGIGWPARDRDADQRDDVRGRIGQGVESVRQDGHRPGD